MRSTFILIAAASCTYGCSTSVGQIQLDKPGNISTLDSSFGIRARLGNTPAELQPSEDLSRYAIKTSGLPTEFVMVLRPRSVDGMLTIPSSKSANLIESVQRYYDYLDSLLRAHRSFLRGEYDTAAEILRELDNTYEITFGSAILAANLELVLGHKEKAAALYRKAKRLYNQSKQLNALVGE